MNNNILTETTTVKNEATDSKFKSSLSMSIGVFIFGVIMVFWFLVLGTISDNRFGAHLVMNTDLTSTPMWYGLTIIWLAVIAITVILIIAALIVKGKIKGLSEGQEKTLRLGGMNLMAISAIGIALSSVVFAVFNNDFYNTVIDNQKEGAMTWYSMSPVYDMFTGEQVIGKVTYATQGVVIACLILVLLIGSLIGTTVRMFISKPVQDKWYYSTRNALLFLIAAGWLVFNINLSGYGSMGGDFGILVNGVLQGQGVTNKDIDFVALEQTLKASGTALPAWGAMGAKDAYNALRDTLSNDGIADLPGYLVAKLVWDPLWNKGTVLGTTLPLPLSELVTTLGNDLTIVDNLIGPWLAGLNKESMFEGVNQSSSAFLLLVSVMAVTIGAPIYAVVLGKRGKVADTSYVANLSNIVIIFITLSYFILTFTFPYVGTTSEWVGRTSEYNPIIDGLFNGTLVSIAPGAAGQMGAHGGVFGTMVYFSPYYHGTLVWDIFFYLQFIILIGGIIGSIFITKPNGDTKKVKEQKAKTDKKKIVITKRTK